MTTAPFRTLEDLRQAAEAAWLWDAARGRIVWANAAGVKLFDGQSVFDLVDRPFDATEAGVARIREVSQALLQGEHAAAQLAFPSLGLTEALSCTCTPHALADGRLGLLVVLDPAKPVMSPAPADAALGLLAALPQPVAFCDVEGRIAHGNPALFDLMAEPRALTLAQLLAEPGHAARILERMSTVALASFTEVITGRLGPRDMRMTALRMPDNGLLAFVMEDITERRALERSLSDMPLPEAPSPPALGKDQAFEQLARSLKESLKDPPAAPVDAPAPEPVPAKIARAVAAASAAAQINPAPEAPSAGARSLPAVPDAIRLPLEQRGEAVIIGRASRPLFATRRAAELLGLADPADLLDNPDLWDQLTAVPDVAALHVVRTRGGEERELIVSRSRIPWQNGPADQFVLRPSETKARQAKALEVVATAPPEVVVHTPGPDLVAPVQTPNVEAIPTPAPLVAPADVRDAIALEEMKAILDVATDGIITLDTDGRIQSFSAGAEAIFGYRSSDVIGQPLADFLSQDSRRALRDYIAALSGPGLASVFNDGREVTAVVKQGGEVPLFLTIGKLQSPKSRAAFCAVVRDITPWKRTERELREAKDTAEAASRQKSEFLARISHELRTPLNAIMGFSDVMRLERFGELRNDKYKAYANDIHSSGAHLLALINDLLDLSKVESGKLELNFTAVSLHDAVDHAMKLLQEESRQARVVVRKAIAPHLPRIVADLRAMRQVLLNLVSNAIKYTDAGGQVIISAAVDDGGNLTLKVKDTGIGMNDNQLRDALEPFTRVDTPDRQRQGTGLGLPLTKALVEANRASFTLSSEPGKGTLAEITFPVTRVLAE